ncbi:hypothetical protein D9758_008786 [Tetrapyrgos nigripes]|uniref:DUF6593 domain-containing protein n=1 Tax=Tetrapyrgos nigripes TaxID=182062 RepID=A0A8H5D3S9_9AGAR|nr:hypothetical protein D9758_008786 [Tetrapyrgos nigripes]
MNFSLDHHNPLKSTFTSEQDGVPLYKVDKHSSHIEIYKLVPSSNGSPQYTLMTQIELHSFHSDKVVLWGKEIRPLDVSGWTGSLTFPGVDGLPYKWKSDGSDYRLRNDSNKLETAFFDHGHDSLFSKSRDRLPVLRVHPDGLKILDQIIATFVYLVKHESDSQTSATAGAVGGAAGAA